MSVFYRFYTLSICILASTFQLFAQDNNSMPYKSSMDISLCNSQHITQSGDINNFDKTFTPKKNFTIELSMLMKPSHKGSLYMTAANGEYTGFEAIIKPDSIFFCGSDPNTSAAYAIHNDGNIHKYRTILEDNKIHLYVDTTLLGSHTAKQFEQTEQTSPFDEPDNEVQQTGIYDKRNLIRNPGFETEDIVINNNADNYQFWPAEWNITNANPKEQQTGTCVRCNKNNSSYANGREGSSALMFRQDGGGGFSAENGSYIYQKLSTPLTAGRRYKLSFQVLSHTNDLGKTYAVAIGSEQGTWDNLYEIWTAPSTKQTVKEYHYEFVAGEQAESHIAFLCHGGSGIIHLDRITLVEEAGDYNRISLIAEDAEGNIDIELQDLSYSEGAFSPIKSITNKLYNGGEYYIYNTYYSRLLGINDDNVPALAGSTVEAGNDIYTWCAEESNKEGYYRLRHKATGRYLAASTTNGWSMTLNMTQAHNNTDLWNITEGTDGIITSLYSGKVLGTDSGQESDEYIGVYYDKSTGELSTWQLVEAQFNLDDSRLALYLNDLNEAIVLGEQIVSSGIYGLAATAILNSCLENARNIKETSTIADIEIIISTTKEVLEAIDTCKESTSEDSKHIQIWATYENNRISLDDSYTLCLNNVTFANDSTTYILIRNRNKQGALVGINRKNITVGSQNITTISDDIETHNYRFVTNNGSMLIYHNGLLKGSASTYEVPALTTGGEKTEYTGLSTQHMSSYIAEVISSSKAIASNEYDGDKYNKVKRQLAMVYNCELTLDMKADYFLLNDMATLVQAKLNICHEGSWLILPHTRPSVAIKEIASIVSINDEKPVSDKNYRAAIYLDGVAIIPYPSDILPFTLYSGELYAGEASSYGTGKHNNLGNKANTIQSFILKRGYMATLAANADGSGYSRVFVADHEDLMVPVVPEALNRRVSSIVVKPWQYVSKKGWGSTAGSSKINNETETIRANWYYTWSADRNNTADLEYVPIKQHLWWPSWSQINALENCTHVLGYNEPEHPEQHGSAQCSCGGAINEWSAFTHHTEFFESGMRIGSPSPTDLGWLKKYAEYCHNYAYRCDFVVTHAYWKEDINTWKSRLQDIYNSTGRPIWITEMENGASWDKPSESNVNEAAKKYQEIFDLLESLDYVERYVPYNTDLWYNRMIYEDGWPTPAGFIFRDYPSSFAYKAEVQYIPDWWKPSLQDVSMSVSHEGTNNELCFAINNPNRDVTESLSIEYSYDEKNWKVIYTESERWRFDHSDYTFSLDASSFENGEIHFRLHITTLIGGETYSNVQSLTLDTSGISGKTWSGMTWLAGKGYIDITVPNQQNISIYTTDGKLAWRSVLKGNHRIALKQGCYIIDGKRVYVK